MAINFFPFNPKAHVLWYSWAKVNEIIPSVNRQSPKNWVMNLRCFLLHFLTLLPINHNFSLEFLHITHLFLNITKVDDLDLEVRRYSILQASSLFGEYCENSATRATQKGVQEWGVGGVEKAPLCSCATPWCVCLSCFTRYFGRGGGGGEESSSRLWDKKSAV